MDNSVYFNKRKEDQKEAEDDIEELRKYLSDFVTQYSADVMSINSKLTILANRVDKLEKCIVPIINKVEESSRYTDNEKEMRDILQSRIDKNKNNLDSIKSDIELINKKIYHFESEIDRIKAKDSITDE